MMQFRTLSGQSGHWRRITLATCLILLAWNSWPQPDIWSPAAGSCVGLVGMTLVASLLSKLWTGHVPLGTESTVKSAEEGTKTELRTDPTGLLVDRMLGHGRQALLLCPELATKMTPQQHQKAQRHLCDTMAIVAAGDVCIAPWKLDDSGDLCAPIELTDHQTTVDGFWLDRLQVSNSQFQVFVNEGGYENESFWAMGVRKRIGDFVDHTRVFGPRYWRNGTFPAGLENHPVVGICWYEAEAFARWQGKRLPTDTEWMNAACGPLTTDDGHSVQRQYPWGQEPKTGVANLWGSHLLNRRPAGTVATDYLPDGATDTGIQQLLGNVWEWTASDFRISTDTQEAVLDRPMKSLRGGAFDSYFGDQATCQMQSGECPFARKHNIGFRCAVTASGLEMNDLSVNELADGDVG
ncbi:MAG: SUMF1/EgtB/PvdO family nonheme iron enzyme [Pirellulaceae bacterium]|nr:SUMF1/EgtB/PvdO family nonheme iron enzyme [Pirellulaceae bacterium]